MPTITDVAVAVFIKPDGQFLLASRPEGKLYAGYWEFPGGKIETGESVRIALRRELIEELNVAIDASTPWFSFHMHYEHASVCLHTWRVTAWHDVDARGMCGLEGQSFVWQRLDDIKVAPTLRGCAPIFRALALPTIYLVTNANEMGYEAYLQHLRAVCDENASKSSPNGVSSSSPRIMIQVREKNMPAEILRKFAREVVAIAHDHAGLALINHDERLANEVGADGVHLTSADLQTCSARPEFPWVGASAHRREDIVRAANLQCDFAVLGAVKPTQSHPGQAALGWDQFSAIVDATPIPIFAIGGMQPMDLTQAIQCGAHGIAMQRGTSRQ